jgi:signal transduction histidine kinase
MTCDHGDGGYGPVMDATPLPSYEAAELDDLFSAREHYLSTGELVPGVRPVVAESWRRSRAYGIDPGQLRRQEADAPTLARARADARRLDERGAPLLEEMTAVLGETPHVLALADHRGRILRLLTAGVPRAILLDANLFEGASWHERDIGCNGVGTALAVRSPVVLIGPEHVQEAYVGWTCIGIPIRDAHGDVTGVIDLSVPNHTIDVRTWGWVLSVVRELELRLRSDELVAPSTHAELGEALSDPLSAVRGVLELLGGQLSTLPSHQRLVHEGLSRLVDVETRLREVVARAAELEGLLADAGRTTTQKLAEVAHEMRNPIGAISAAVGILEHTETEPKVSRATDVIRRQLTMLTRLAADVSGERSEGRRPTSIEPREIDLRRVVEDAASTVAPEIDRRQHVLRLRLPDEPLPLVGDPVRLHQALVNLLTNAAKYTEPGGRIELACSHEANELVVSVRDSGRGIPPGQLARIFDPYARTAEVRERGITGRGLGLALVHEIVERHGGRVAAHSEGPGHGSEFTLWIPARTSEDSAQRPRRRDALDERIQAAGLHP